MVDKRAQEPSSTPRATPEIVDPVREVGLLWATAMAAAAAVAWLVVRTARRRHA